MNRLMVVWFLAFILALTGCGREGEELSLKNAASTPEGVELLPEAPERAAEPGPFAGMFFVGKFRGVLHGTVQTLTIDEFGNVEQSNCGAKWKILRTLPLNVAQIEVLSTVQNWPECMAVGLHTMAFQPVKSSSGLIQIGVVYTTDENRGANYGTYFLE